MPLPPASLTSCGIEALWRESIPVPVSFYIIYFNIFLIQGIKSYVKVLAGLRVEFWLPWEIRISFHFLQKTVQFSQHNLVKMLSSLQCMILYFCLFLGFLFFVKLHNLCISGYSILFHCSMYLFLLLYVFSIT